MFTTTLRMVVRDRTALVSCVVTVVAALALFVFLPVQSTPGNTVRFQLSLLRSSDWLLMVTLALLIGATVAVEVVAWHQRRGRMRSVATRTAVGSASGLFGVLVGTAACSSCLASILGLVGIGFGGTLFVLKHRTPFLIGAITLSALTFTLAVRRLHHSCTTCA